MPLLRIAINGRFQHRRITGVERYAYEISRRLQLPKRFISPKRSLGQFAGHAWEQFILPTIIQKDEMLWSPANTSTWSVANQVVTIHDASVFDHPEWFRPAFAVWTWLSWKILAKRTKAIITVSEFSKQRLKHRLGIPEEKIHVIYNGVGKPFEPQSQKSIEKVKGKYGIKNPYFLFVGTLEPRKNLTTLLRAWEMAGLEEYELVIVGAESVGRVFNVTNSISLVSHANSVTYIPDEDLPALYSGATAFVFPTLYEGFGLPVLEAMACGTPVIASDIVVFHEFFEGAALFVNPLDAKGIATGMQTIIEDKTLAIGLRESGIRKAEELTWENSAMKTQTILEKARDSDL